MSDMPFEDIESVIFDMDGTLIDSELHAETSVRSFLIEREIDHQELDCTRFYGITWPMVAALLLEEYAELRGLDVADDLQRRFHHMVLHEHTPMIPGARRFFLECCRSLPTAIASSSNRESVAHVVERLGAGELVSLFVGAEDYERSKPDPECYLLVAGRLGADPQRCLVFEDSVAGLQAAKSAGMSAVAITHRSPNLERARQLADLAVENYTELDDDFTKRMRITR